MFLLRQEKQIKQTGLRITLKNIFMKQIIAAVLVLCFCIPAGAQKIKKMEYFFDNDPGVGKAKPFPVAASDTVNITADIPINNLSKGLHALYMRAKSDTGWGLTEAVLFNVYDSLLTLPVSKEEYFFDSDPGVDKATPFAINTTDTLKAVQALSTGSLPEGFHTLYVRVGNNGGYYSLTENASFYVTGFASNAAKISGAEYFIDTDPGAGKAKKLNTGAQTDTLLTSYNLQVPAGLDTSANHYLCIRVKDAAGAWSLFTFDTFKVKVNAAFAMLNIHASKEASKAMIQWQTTNSDAVNYTVEKSTNGIDFTELNNVVSKGSSQTYNSKDAAPVNGINFYRIKQTNAAGDVSYSSIAKVLFEAADPVMLYPNPAKDFVNIRFNAAGKTILINVFNSAGRSVKMFSTAAAENIQLNVNSFASGTYLLHIIDGEKTFTAKLVKQ